MPGLVVASSKAHSRVGVAAEGLRPSCISSDISEKEPIINAFPLTKMAWIRIKPVPVSYTHLDV